VRTSRLTLPFYLAKHDAAIQTRATLVFPCMTALDIMPIAALMKHQPRYPQRTKHSATALWYARIMGRPINEIETDLFRAARNAFADNRMVPWHEIEDTYFKAAAVVDGMLGREWPEEKAA
jgi:hypothetical protein